MLEKLKKRFMVSRSMKIGASALAMASAMPMTSFAADGTVLTGVTSVLEWYLTAMTSITTWLVGNDLGAIYIGIFIIGCAVALMFRILHSA